jgi:phosphoglycerate kinase
LVICFLNHEESVIITYYAIVELYMSLLMMTAVNCQNKRIMIREDFNVPMNNGVITSDARLLAALPTIKQAQQRGANVILLSHLGRPEEGKYDDKFSLAPVALRLAELLQQPVILKKDWLNGFTQKDHEIVLCENVRFNPGEKKDDEQLAKKMAALCDIFVMDAFATAHRAEASTHGVAKFAPMACAGPLLVNELSALTRALANPQRPFIAIVGGSKVSTKITVLEKLLEKVDHLIVGGGIANTFLAAAGYGIGISLYEPDLMDEAKRLLAIARSRQVTIHLPNDVIVANEFAARAIPRCSAIDEIFPHEMILDVGPQTAVTYSELLAQAGTIVWNGPVGVFEFPGFSQGTKALAEAIAASKAFSLAGGGDTLAAIDQFQVADNISYISTGGGAFLEFVEGKTLPAVAILEKRAETQRG